jgi:hypothetical protein
VYYRDHLRSLRDALEAHPDAVLADSGVRHHYNRLAEGIIDGYCLQLVQVLHRKSAARWMERQELVSDDLGRMYWKKLEAEGAFVPTNTLTCEWVDHPHQRYKILREPIGASTCTSTATSRTDSGRSGSRKRTGWRRATCIRTPT